MDWAMERKETGQETKRHNQSLTSTRIILQDAKVMPPKCLICMYLK